VFSSPEEKISRQYPFTNVPSNSTPNFAIAYARLGTAYQNLGEVELAHENMEKAFRLKDRASEREGPLHIRPLPSRLPDDSKERRSARTVQADPPS
jgi:hypothetical protein